MITSYLSLEWLNSYVTFVMKLGERACHRKKKSTLKNFLDSPFFHMFTVKLSSDFNRIKIVFLAVHLYCSR